MNIECRGETVNIATGGVEVDRDLPPVVLLHGAGMDRTVWSQQTRYLAHHGFAAMAVDLPGHGESGGEPLSSIAEMADWVAEAITEIGLGPAHLVGHSMGSLISLEVAARHPEAVAPRMMVAPIVSRRQTPLGIDGPAKLTTPDDQCLIK